MPRVPHQRTLVILTAAAIAVTAGPLLLGRGAPGQARFEARLLDGGTVTSWDLSGKPVVLEFWATWCAPCRRSLSALDALADRYGPRLYFFAANADNEDAARVRAFRDEMGLRTPVLMDARRLASDLGVTTLPAAVVLSDDGRVVARLDGTDAVPAVLDRMLAPP